MSQAFDTIRLLHSTVQNNFFQPQAPIYAGWTVNGAVPCSALQCPALYKRGDVTVRDFDTGRYEVLRPWSAHITPRRQI